MEPIRGRVSRKALEREPYLTWNAFVDVIGLSDPDQLSPVQRPAQLVFLYYSEIANGGHLQYFENRGTAIVPDTIEALKLLGANDESEILREACRRRRSRARQRIETSEKFADEAMTEEFADLDQQMNELDENANRCLSAYLHAHLPEFIEFVP